MAEAVRSSRRFEPPRFRRSDRPCAGAGPSVATKDGTRDALSVRSVAGATSARKKLSPGFHGIRLRVQCSGEDDKNENPKSHLSHAILLRACERCVAFTAAAVQQNGPPWRPHIPKR